MGYLSEDQLLAFLRNFYNVPSVDLKRYKIKEEVIKLIPEDMAKKHGLIPVGFKDIKGKKNHGRNHNDGNFLPQGRGQ